MKSLLIFFLLVAAVSLPGAAAPDFAQVFRILDEKCVECHAKDDFEGGLVLEDHAGLMKGGETGAAVVAGKSGESLLMRYLKGEVEKDGKRRFMPPGKREKLSVEEIQLLAQWIDAGALPSATPEKPREITVPKISPRVPPRKAVNALAYDPVGKVLAIGRYGAVDLVSAETRAPLRTLEGLKGKVNALVFTADGSQIFAASGENAVFGEVKQWQVGDGTLVRTFQGHRDTIYALALSPEGGMLATGSYDQQIKLWDVAEGTELRTLRGHNGAVFAVAFRGDGRILASASADRTVKLWDVQSGQRRDTFSQPQKEQVALAWSPDGRRLAAGGFDNRIRVWEVTPTAKETTNPLIVARFAHEGALMRLVWSGDGQTLASSAQDGTVKLWDGETIRERLLLEKQPDWPSALALAGPAVIAGRLDGTLGFYDAQSGAAVPPPAPPKPPAQPSVTGVDPRGVQRGVTANLRLTGKGLSDVKSVQAPGLTFKVVSVASTQVRLQVTCPAEAPREPVDVTVTDSAGQVSAPMKLYVDDLPQVTETVGLKAFPATVWGTLSMPGETDRLEFDAAAGQTLVFDLASKSIGSKTDATLTLTDQQGRVLASSNDFDRTGEPLVAHTFAAAGRYAIRVADLEAAGSSVHFYRLTAGALPLVTACFPLSVTVGQESTIKLIGFNLPAEAAAKVKPEILGEFTLPLEASQYRSRRGFKLLATALAHTLEVEPNDVAAAATPLAAPGTGAGILQAPAEGRPDVDLYRFEAKAGSTWVIETAAAQRGSPVDTKIEVLDAKGQPVPRLVLQAVRDSAITFRPIDSVASAARVDNWREMALNQYMYLGGEVAKIFRMPEGPDSGFEFYKAFGKRVAYFDTSATAHALDEPCYVVEAHPPGTALIANGLPVFPLFYTNDDDGSREIGTDSRLLFTAPVAGAYLVSVTDSRGLGGERFAYDVSVRMPAPDFSVAMTGFAGKVPAGSGQPFTLAATRHDGWEGDIAVTLEGLPPGWTVTTPLIIEAGHQEAEGTIHAPAEAAPKTKVEMAQVSITAIAEVNKATVRHAVSGVPNMSVGLAPEFLVALEPVAPGDTIDRVTPATKLQPQDPAKPFEITIAPGETIPAWVKIQRRNEKTAAVRFDINNLPHGCVVDNLGLNGITLLEGQTEGEIHLKCDPWVQEMDRTCYALTRGNGAMTSLPVILHVRKSRQE